MILTDRLLTDSHKQNFNNPKFSEYNKIIIYTIFVKIIIIMLSKITIKKMLKLFKFLQESEEHIEALREILCGQQDFEPYSIFRQLDSDRNGWIEPAQIISFMRINNLLVTLEELEPLIDHYGYDGKIKYTDFMHIVLTTTNLNLRTLVT